VNQPQANPDSFNTRNTVNVLYVFAKVGECLLTVFIRTGFGPEYPGVLGPLALILLVTIAGLSAGPGRDYVLLFFLAWLIAIIFQRYKTLRLARSGHHEHSRCSGSSWFLLWLFPVLETEEKARNAEPVLFLIVGFLAKTTVPTLGTLLWFSALSLLVTRVCELQIGRLQVQRMRDAEIEMRQTVRRYRGG
jgi:hypothetical protein